MKMFWKVIGAAIGGIAIAGTVTYYVYPMVVKPVPITDSEIRKVGYIMPGDCPQ